MNSGAGDELDAVAGAGRVGQGAAAPERRLPRPHPAALPRRHGRQHGGPGPLRAPRHAPPPAAPVPGAHQRHHPGRVRRGAQAGAALPQELHPPRALHGRLLRPLRPPVSRPLPQPPLLDSPGTARPADPAARAGPVAQSPDRAPRRLHELPAGQDGARRSESMALQLRDALLAAGGDQ